MGLGESGDFARAKSPLSSIILINLLELIISRNYNTTFSVIGHKGEGEDTLVVRRKENNNQMSTFNISAHKDHYNPLGRLPSLLLHYIYW